ncbi:MAG: hypothetical protein ACO3K7_02425 [Candidatus Marinamargulisbacteria bacterium]
MTPNLVWLFFLTVWAHAIEFGLVYMNPSQTPFVQLNTGFVTQLAHHQTAIQLGIHYLDMATASTIHNRHDGPVISRQTVWSIPMSINTQWQPQRRLTLFAGVGYAFYGNQVLDANHVNTIESTTGIHGKPLIKNYTESIQNHVFYRLGLSLKFMDHWVVSVAKIWQTWPHKVAYTYLNDHHVQFRQEVHYEPISVSVRAHF